MGEDIKNSYGNNFLSWMENSEFVIAMRRGLLICIPIFIVGSFCVLFTSFPIEVYQEWIKEVCNGWIYQAILFIYNATLGSITLFVIFSVSYSYASQIEGEDSGYYMLTSIVSYIVFAQKDVSEISFKIFDTTWVFTGMLITLLSCWLFKKFSSVSKRHAGMKYHNGVDMDFSNTVMVIIPVLCVILVLTVVKLFMLAVWGDELQNVGSVLMMRLFSTIGTGVMGAFLFVFLIHIMWFFGIHGSNLLSMVSVELFEAGMLENIAAVAAGGEAVNIFTKTFVDVFVLMGGSGTTICLLLALFFTKKKKSKVLFKVSIIPALFNINEIVLFGLPVVFNPIMIIPFVIVPLVMTAVSALSMYIGLVPVPFRQVEWTTPVFFSGYLSTESMAGVILQIVLIALGTLIYLPFIKMSEEYYDKLLKNNIKSLQDEIMECEQTGEHINLKKGPRSKRDVVKMLTKDLRAAIQNDEIMLYYQPQVTSENEVYGVEALLRWKHPVAGFLYPPLVIEIARQDNLLDKLGMILIEKAAKDLEYLAKKLSKPIHMAVNISPVQFESDTFCQEVEAVLKRYDFGECTMCFEITEQMALSTSGIVSDRIEKLKKAGIPFHMDDFGMGHSSMKYLQNNEFAAVKLDGSLVREMMDNNRSQNIISGIHQMALPLNYELIAEYVETEEQKKRLKELGCYIYQGKLYSMPLPMGELEAFLKKYKTFKEQP